MTKARFNKVPSSSGAAPPRLTRGRWLVALVALSSLAVVACDGGGSVGTGGTGNTGQGGGGQGGGGSPPTGAVVDLVVDANRDGVANLDGSDEAGEDAFSATAGASFLANLDDDDGDEIRDADDEAVNGAEDEKDLAPILVRAWPDAPDGATGTLTLTSNQVDAVRIWKKNADASWSLVLGATGCHNVNEIPWTAEEQLPCTPQPTAALSTDELRAGVTLGIEARNFRMGDGASDWDGMVNVALAVVDADGAPVSSDQNPTGTDTVALKVAPWMLHGNLSVFDRVHFMDWEGSSNEQPFTDDMIDYANEHGMTPVAYDNWQDQWTQDWLQTGFTAIPGPNGTVQGMQIANARPWGRAGTLASLPANWLRNNYLGPGFGVLETYASTMTPCTSNSQCDSNQCYSSSDTCAPPGDSYDSHGNHDLIPPYENGTSSYPYGRIAIGSGVIKETRDFYDAQGPQSPYFQVDTSWLIVGHIDETLSYAPANTPRGWKLLVGDPTLARQRLEALTAAGHGAAIIAEGQMRYNSSGMVISAEKTIDEVLADVELMQWAQEAQAEIDGQLDDFIGEVGLANDEIIPMPFLFEEECYGANYCVKVSWDPGTVNMLVMGDSMAIPDPFGPVINGEDDFKAYLLAELGTAKNGLGSDGQGMDISFIDNWYGYHILLGEVHCGSNPEGPPNPSWKWWEL
jgi:protein-arginine deiminase